MVKLLIDESRWGLKCPFEMVPEFIVVHNTSNDATAFNEITFMHRNNNSTSFHVAVDDTESILGIPLDRNAWHAGDGRNGEGNRKGIGIEICFSKSGGPRYDRAELRAVKLIAEMLKERNWGVDRVKKHQDFSGKYCPHRILDNGWDKFIEKIENELKQEHWAEKHFKSLNEKGITVNERRFDDLITRGEVMALLDRGTNGKD